MTDQQATQYVHDLIPFSAHLGLNVAENTPERVVMALPHADHLCTAGGILHGGALMALADNAGALCASRNLPEGAGGTATVESKTNFLRGARTDVVATSTPLHAGKRFVVVQTDIHDTAGKLVARVTQTQAVL